MKPATRTEARSAAFGYICRCCTRCCRNHDVAINPYETARLARNLGQTIAQFRAMWTRDGAGTMLKQTETGDCVFLSGERCSVYADRPLVCRIFPLARNVSADGTEHFLPIEGEPPPGGEFTGRGTISDFLEKHGAVAFAEAADDYYRWLCAALNSPAGQTADLQVDPAETAALAANLLDMDSAVAAYCAATGEPEPTDIEERKQRHLAFLYQKLDEYPANGKGVHHG